jgi:hypothetical protein
MKDNCDTQIQALKVCQIHFKLALSTCFKHKFAPVLAQAPYTFLFENISIYVLQKMYNDAAQQIL